MYTRHQYISGNLGCEDANTELSSNIICKMAETVIPLVDLDNLALSSKDAFSQPAEKLQAISLECARALRKYGIMYVKNHGIPEELVSCYNNNQNYKKTQYYKNNGYIHTCIHTYIRVHTRTYTIHAL